MNPGDQSELEASSLSTPFATLKLFLRLTLGADLAQTRIPLKPALLDRSSFSRGASSASFPGTSVGIDARKEAV